MKIDLNEVSTDNDEEDSFNPQIEKLKNAMNIQSNKTTESQGHRRQKTMSPTTFTHEQAV